MMFIVVMLRVTGMVLISCTVNDSMSSARMSPSTEVVTHLMNGLIVNGPNVMELDTAV